MHTAGVGRKIFLPESVTMSPPSAEHRSPSCRTMSLTLAEVRRCNLLHYRPGEVRIMPPDLAFVPTTLYTSGLQSRCNFIHS